MSKLSAIKVRNSKPKEKDYKLSDGRGLYLHVAKSGRKTWRYRYEYIGKETTYVIGEYPTISLEQARTRRTEARELVKSGLSPTAERKDQKRILIEQVELKRQAEQNTFAEIAREWIRQQDEKWSYQHSNHVLNTLQKDAFPTLGDVDVSKIEPPMILQIIRSVESRGSYEIASKVLQRINAVCRYAVQTGRAKYNPAGEMRGVLKTRKVNHRAAISKEQLPQFLLDLESGDIHNTTKLALKFLILTATRSGEVRAATWDEISFDDELWRIPAERMKMNTAHVIPLSQQALEILRTMSEYYGQDGLIFPGIKDQSKQLSENTMLYALYRLGYHSRATVHGFRATFSTIANESGFDGDVIEKALAHEERNRVRAAYHRSEYPFLPKFVGVSLFCQANEFINLGLQLLFELTGMIPAQGMVLGGIGFHLGAIKADFAQFQKAHFTGKHQNLYKERFQLLQKPLAEGSYGVMIWVGVGGDKTKGNGVIGCLLNFSAGEYAGSITV